MELYISNTPVNSGFQEILIVKSKEPVIFQDMGRFVQEERGEDSNTVTTYLTHPFVYREFPPEKGDGEYFYYWFLLRSMTIKVTANYGVQVEALQRENTFLKAQVQAVTNRADFMEDCVAEMASIVYA